MNELQDILTNIEKIENQQDFLKDLNEVFAELRNAYYGSIAGIRNVETKLDSILTLIGSKDTAISSSIKLKASIPIIPAILSLEKEINLDDQAGLKLIWNKIKEIYNKLKKAVK